MRKDTINPKGVDKGQGKDLGTMQCALRGGRRLLVYSGVFTLKRQAMRLGSLRAKNGKPLEAEQEDSCPIVFLVVPDLSESQSLFIVPWSYGFFKK